MREVVGFLMDEKELGRYHHSLRTKNRVDFGGSELWGQGLIVSLVLSQPRISSTLGKTLSRNHFVSLTDAKLSAPGSNKPFIAYSSTPISLNVLLELQRVLKRLPCVISSHLMNPGKNRCQQNASTKSPFHTPPSKTEREEKNIRL